jgi:2-hydroxy-3-oxopropionate reductase
VLKLTNNILSAVALAATAEAFVMGAKGGLDPEVMLGPINAGSGRNSATESKFPTAVLTRSFDYGAEMHILMKDIDLAVAQGENSACRCGSARQLASCSSTRCTKGRPRRT